MSLAIEIQKAVAIRVHSFAHLFNSFQGIQAAARPVDYLRNL
jgi:hypothetical protein